MFFKPSLPRYDIPDIGPLISAVHGEINPGKITLFAPVKNEMALLPAFLAYYRSLGFEQFLIFDDRSDDGTFDYLRAQPDCVVVHTRKTFGEELHYAGRTHKNIREMRFGTFVKMAIPQHFLKGRIVAYFDADEFLLLPPGVRHIGEVYERIEALGSTGALASVVEFFPRSTASFARPLPDSFEGLMEEYGWFEAEPLFDPAAGMDANGKPRFLNPSKSMRLFDTYGITPEIRPEGLRQKIYMSSREKRAQTFNRSARHKTPILRHDDESFLYSAHDAFVPPKGDILLTIAHFVFTAKFAAKIEEARKWRAHAGGGRKYLYYRELLDKMRGAEDGFLSDRSQRYESAQQLVDAGLMRWPDP